MAVAAIQTQAQAGWLGCLNSFGVEIMLCYAQVHFDRASRERERRQRKMEKREEEREGRGKRDRERLE